MEPLLQPTTVRFECKYLLSEALAHQIRAHVQFHMKPDAFSSSPTDASYLVTSLYLDSPDYSCFRSTIGGEKNRFKLRIRWYDDESGVVFLEEKRRTNDGISKLRVKIRRSAVGSLRRGIAPGSDMVVDKSPAAMVEARYMADLIQGMRASAACLVRYRREAWMGRDNDAIRVTFDRTVEAHPDQETIPGRDSRLWFPAGDEQVILELKFHREIPVWLSDLIHRFNLNRLSVPKYINALESLEALGRIGALPRWGMRAVS